MSKENSRTLQGIMPTLRDNEEFLKEVSLQLNLMLLIKKETDSLGRGNSVSKGTEACNITAHLGHCA